MYISQISIFAENRNGSIAEITAALSAAGINIRALSIADTSDFGVVRLIVDRTGAAIETLKAAGLAVIETPVIAVSVEDAPGSFNRALKALSDGAIMIEYAYAFVAPIGGGATIILRCREQELAVRLLQKDGFHLLTQDEVTK